MKEAAGEANMTVITIALIAIVLAAGTFIVNNMMNTTGQSSACESAGGTWKNGKCYASGSCTVDATGKTSCSGTTLSCTNSGGTWTCTGQ